jgi:hypothetical protein
MRFWKPTALISTFLVLTSLCLAQAETATPDPEKEQAKKEENERIVQMLDQVISDAALLRLPQNKAIVLAMAGDLYWKFDEKKSRDLFRSAASEILAYNADAEREKRDSTEMYTELFDMGDPRMQVLPLVGKNDAELALELLLQTRPVAITEAMLKASAPNAQSGENMLSFSPENQRVRRELEMEQRFAVLAADENPDRAIKMIKDSLAKGVSYNVLQLLQKLNKKDEKKALELASEVVRKLIDTDLARKNDELGVAINYVQFMSRAGNAPADAESKNKPFRFTDAQAKDLANKLVSTFMQPSNSAGISMSLSRAMPHLEKIVPDKAALLKQRQAENQKNLPSELRNFQRMEKLYDPSSTPEQILAEIPKMQNEIEKRNAYQVAAQKIGQIDDEARAKKLIDQIGDDRARTRAQEQFESARISRAASTGKLEDARKMIGTLTNKRIQVQKLVSLAQQFHKKGTETDIESAKDLMKSARSLVNETPEDEDELNNLMEVVRGYSTVEPDVAFRLFEPIVDQINDIIHASAILSKYNKRNRSFKKGELILRTTNSSMDGILLFRYLNQIQLLGKADLARMGSLADRFQRSDARTIVKLVAVQGVSRDDKRAVAQAPFNDFVYFEN